MSKIIGLIYGYLNVIVHSFHKFLFFDFFKVDRVLYHYLVLKDLSLDFGIALLSLMDLSERKPSNSFFNHFR